ncbi:MAG TPA: FtsX-like permease family protein, partial [Bryobacteraceae bacterium]|nr:FtsX-like permease family protein [Bryobacteraceae bacterium]
MDKVRLFKLVSVLYLRRHAARYLLLASGVAIGTAVFLAMHAATATLSASFDETVNAMAGQTHVQVSAGDPGVPETVLHMVQALDIIENAVPVIEASVETTSGAGLLVLGVDLTGDASVRSYGNDVDKRTIAGLDALTFIAQPDSLLITSEFADRQRLRVGDRIPLRTIMGPKNFVVRGIVSRGSAAFSNANVAVMDVYAAQAIFGRGERFDRIDVRLKPGAALEDARARIRSALGSGFTVERPAERSAELDNLLSSYSLLQNSISLFALLLGMAMISSAFRLSVAQRRVEIGILRALGATRAQIGQLFLLEGVATGVIGALLGAVLGVALSTLMLRYMGQLLRPVFPTAASIEQQFPDPWLIAAAIAVGIIVSVLAAVGPAWEAASLSPCQAMRSVLPAERMRPLSRSAIAGGTAMAASAFLPASSSSGLYLRVGFLVIGVIACAPWLILTLLQVARPLLARIQPPAGSVAVDSLTRSPRRTTATVVVLTLAFAQVLVVSGVSQSGHATLAEWARRQLDQDLLVSSSPNLVNRSLQFPHTIVDRLRSVSGVAE